MASAIAACGSANYWQQALALLDTSVRRGLEANLPAPETRDSEIPECAAYFMNFMRCLRASAGSHAMQLPVPVRNQVPMHSTWTPLA